MSVVSLVNWVLVKTRIVSMQWFLTLLVLPFQGHGAAAASWGLQVFFPNVQSIMQRAPASLSRRIGPRHVVYKAATRAPWSPPTFPVLVTLLHLPDEIKAWRLNSCCQLSGGVCKWFLRCFTQCSSHCRHLSGRQIAFSNFRCSNFNCNGGGTPRRGVPHYCDLMCDIYKSVIQCNGPNILGAKFLCPQI
jgi:hypothetical protein